MPYNIAIGIMQVTAIVSILINIKTIMSRVIGLSGHNRLEQLGQKDKTLY